jgi:hypothetical protein
MNATIYWTGQRIQRAVHEAPFRAKLWWLNQQVGFLEWRVRLEAFLPSQSLAAPVLRRNTSCTV